MAKLDYTKQGDIKYLMGFAVSLNFQKLMEQTAFITGVSQNQINKPNLLTKYLVELYERGQQKEIEQIFSAVPIDFESENGSSYLNDAENRGSGLKPFSETLVGGLLLSILYPGQTSGAGVNDPGTNEPDEQEISPMKLAMYILGGVFILILVMFALYLVFTKVGK